jgi:hypothetical protein
MSKKEAEGMSLFFHELLDSIEVSLATAVTESDQHALDALCTALARTWFGAGPASTITVRACVSLCV